jgi:uridine nucleosidase
MCVMTQKIIFDTDPGVDDSMALLFGLASPELEVVGVTTVFGNVEVEQTTRNALYVLEVGGRLDIPVVAGAAKALQKPMLERKFYIHGRDGLGGVALEDYPRPATAWEGGAAGYIADTVLAQPGEITLVAVGPLTNLALAVQRQPALAGAVKQVIIMGGAVYCRGNASPVAEANIWNDPHAASIVFGAGWPVVLVGLDVTMRTIMSSHYLEELAKARRPATNFISQIVPAYQDGYRRRQTLDGIPTHDPAAMAYAIDPSLFHTQRVPLYVELEGRCAGQTVADIYGHWAPQPAIDVCVDVDASRLLALFRARVTA